MYSVFVDVQEDIEKEDDGKEVKKGGKPRKRRKPVATQRLRGGFQQQRVLLKEI